MPNIVAWRQHLQDVLQERPKHYSWVNLGDLSCKLGSIVTSGIGACAADFEDVGGEQLRAVCGRHSMFVVNTHDQLNGGQDWTYTSPQGHRSRHQRLSRHDPRHQAIKCRWQHRCHEWRHGSQNNGQTSQNKKGRLTSKRIGRCSETPYRTWANPLASKTKLARCLLTFGPCWFVLLAAWAMTPLGWPPQVPLRQWQGLLKQPYHEGAMLRQTQNLLCL